jgi:hypothetical protein
MFRGIYRKGKETANTFVKLSAFGKQGEALGLLKKGDKVLLQDVQAELSEWRNTKTDTIQKDLIAQLDQYGGTLIACENPLRIQPTAIREERPSQPQTPREETGSEPPADMVSPSAQVVDDEEGLPF